MFGRRSTSILIKYRKIHNLYFYNLTKSFTVVSLKTLWISLISNLHWDFLEMYMVNSWSIQQELEALKGVDWL